MIELKVSDVEGGMWGVDMFKKIPISCCSVGCIETDNDRPYLLRYEGGIVKTEIGHLIYTLHMTCKHTKCKFLFFVFFVDSFFCQFMKLYYFLNKRPALPSIIAKIEFATP